jgi:hypothetical protein
VSVEKALKTIRTAFGPSHTEVTTKLPEKVAGLLKEIADKEGTTVSSLVKLAVVNYIIEYYKSREKGPVVLEPLDTKDNVKYEAEKGV